ncbi:hypothetical protein [Pseudomonas sp. PIC25]
MFGGSRIRGDFGKGSDIDVGFGSLSEKQAQRIIRISIKRQPIILIS